MNGLNEVVVAAYGRSAVGRARKGGLAFAHPVDFGAQVLRGVLDRVPALDPADIDDVVVGCSNPSGKQGSNIARQIVLRADLPVSIPAETVCRFCSSGLQAISIGANAIMTGQAQVVVAGGVESMSALPINMGLDDRSPWLVEHKPNSLVPMGGTAENVAEAYGVTREEMDALAVESHKRAAAAQAAGKFDGEIIPVEVPYAEGSTVVFSRDDGIRPNTTMESLAGLKTVFKENGTVTAGTSSQTSDGAGFLVLMSREKADALGIEPIARFLAYAVAGVEPHLMGIGPIYAVPKVMKLTGLKIADMDVIELNEAFAAQAIPCIRELGLDMAKVNPNGGAMALGHPLGATGAILSCKALAELERTGGRYALITMCVGGGMGAAGIYERLPQKRKLLTESDLPNGFCCGTI